MDQILHQKKTLRKALIERRDLLTLEQKQTKSIAACEQLILLTNNRKYRTVMVYIPFRSELDTWPYIQWCWEQSIQVLVPRCEVSKRKMTLYPLYNKQQLHSGAYGILEPNPELVDPVHCIPDAVIVPGLAFNSSGHRLGYGGGYYDRYYEQIGNKTTWIGVGFEEQIVEPIPHDQHDIILNIFVSNKGIETFS